MRPKLALLLFLFALATIYLVSSFSCKTYAQDEEAGIMTLSSGAGKIAYSRLSDLVLAERGQSYYTRETSTTHPAETYAYILKDIEDDATGDVWLFSGCVLTYDTNRLRWLKVELTASLYAVNGNWALKSSSVSFGLPYMKIDNNFGLTYLEAETFFMVYVLAERKLCELNGVTFNESSYSKYINCDVLDTDGGGVNDIAEWVRGTAIDDWTDDKPSGNACMCGACCRCKCECRKWDGSTCTGESGEDGCDCHKGDDPDEEECVCSNYCCLDKCECKACKDKTESEHGKHKNGSSTCAGSTDEGGCDCHKGDDPDEEECVCSNYCCLDKCECKACLGGDHGKHQNGLTYCNQGTDPKSGGCSCHGTTDDEECACSKYCCLDKCECKACKDKTEAEHGKHKNGSSTCAGSTGKGGCDCHKGDDPEEEECACAKYCCYHTCKCKRCASLSAEQHSQHKNGSPTCTGTTGEGGCDCHKDDKVEFPEGKDYEVPEEERKGSFLPGSDFNYSFLRLKDRIERKFGLVKLSSLLKGDLSGELPCWSFPLPALLGDELEIDLNQLGDYKIFAIIRKVLVFWVYYFTIMTVFNSLRRLL